MEKDPVFYARFGQQYYKTCIKSNPFVGGLLVRNTGDSWTMEHLKCIASAIREALDKTPYEQLWAQYEKALKVKIEAIRSCKNKPTPEEIRKYTIIL